MSKSINGKKPISSKPATTFDMTDDPFGNKLSLPPSFVDGIKEAGFEIRFVNMKVMKELGGYHPRQWVPFQKNKFDKIDMSEFHWGSDPDGRIIRGDLVLAVRPAAVGDKHRAWLKGKADRLSKNQQKNAAELKRMAGSRAVIHEGYEDE